MDKKEIYKYVPQYIRIAEGIKESIRKKKIKADELLPSERKLAEKYNVSRNTAISVLNKLVAEGWAYRIKGKGTYATLPSIKNNIHKNIGLIIPNGETGILAQLTEIIEKEIYNTNYHIILCYSNFDFEKQENQANLLVEKKVCGVIFCPILSNKEYKRNEKVVEIFEKNGIPVVLIDMYLPGKDVDYVVSDNFKGVYEGTKYLISLGHKKIAFISSLLGSSIKERMDGFKKAMEEEGLPVRDKWVKIPGVPDIRTGYKETLELLEEKEKPTAIFCAHDLIAISCLQALNEMGIKIPEEISVMGFDNLPFSALTHPPLTTIAQNFTAMGKKAVEILIDKIEKRNLKTQKYKIPVKLKIRETVSAPAYKKIKKGGGTYIKRS